jgi:hypothetical protein
MTHRACEECGGPVQRGDVLCDQCWDAVAGREWQDEGIVDLVDEPCGQLFPDEPAVEDLELVELVEGEPSPGFYATRACENSGQ